MVVVRPTHAIDTAPDVALALLVAISSLDRTNTRANDAIEIQSGALTEATADGPIQTRIV